jgi:hypothetical protein
MGPSGRPSYLDRDLHVRPFCLSVCLFPFCSDLCCFLFFSVLLWSVVPSVLFCFALFCSVLPFCSVMSCSVLPSILLCSILSSAVFSGCTTEPVRLRWTCCVSSALFCHSVLFCFALFCSVLLRFALFCSVLFGFILFYSTVGLLTCLRRSSHSL